MLANVSIKFCLCTQRHPHIFSLHDVAGDGNYFYSSLEACSNTSFLDRPAARDWLIAQEEKELLSESKGKTIKEHWAKSSPDATLEQWALHSRCNGAWGSDLEENLLTYF